MWRSAGATAPSSVNSPRRLHPFAASFSLNHDILACSGQGTTLHHAATDPPAIEGSIGNCWGPTKQTHLDNRWTSRLFFQRLVVRNAYLA